MIVVAIVLIFSVLIFDWGRRSNVFISDQDGDVMVYSPKINSAITNGIVKISGTAKGTWYFEASFPIQIQDSEGNVLATGTATALSDWMTENPVPFSSDILFFASTTTNYGKIVLKNDNPSGDPTKDKFFEVPVSFNK